MLTVSTVLWDTNEHSEPFSRCYTDAWAERLFSAFRRHLTVSHRSVLFTDRYRDLPASIEQVVIPGLGSNGYGDCVQPFALNEPMIFTGLDTLIVGNCDHLAAYCMEADRIALPKHPFKDFSINGVVLCPAGHRRIFDDWRGENDMDWMRKWPHSRIDDLWPGHVVSYKGSVKLGAVGDARIVYFHGTPKMADLVDKAAWVRDAWR